jgi:GNAT superfamily N-acetyltransferase
VHVRDAVDDDVSALCTLWSDLCKPGDSQGEALEARMGRAVTRWDADADSRVLVAELDGDVVGCAFLRTGLVSPVDDDHVVHVSHLQVDPAASRHGVGRSLVEAATTWAEQRGVESLVVATAANDRDANRFLARLGLVQVAVLRGAAVTALRARLPHDPGAVARHGARAGRSVGQVVAARRSQRRARNRQVAL